MNQMLIIDPATEPLARPGICLPRSRAFGAASFFPTGARDRIQRIPRVEWSARDLEHYAGPILDQNGLNACTAAAWCAGLQIARARDGLNLVPLALGPLYGQINGGTDAGAPIDAGMRALQLTGTLASDDCDPLQWRLNQLRADWRERAADYRVDEAFDLDGIDDVGTALELGDPIVAGINWGRGAHAICIIGKKPDADGYLFHFQNSWGRDWGERGFAWMRERDIKGLETYGAFAIRSATVARGDPAPPRPRR